MAPHEPVKQTPKVQRNIKTSATKGRSSPASIVKRTTIVKKALAKAPLQVNNATASTTQRKAQLRPRTNTVPQVATPKPKENKSVPDIAPGSVNKSAKKPLWKRRPQAAHSGVPMPEKMLKQQLKLRDQLCI